MTEIVITLVVILLAMVMFAWNKIPAGVVAVGATLALYFTGVLTAPEMLSGFGDPVVILIIALLAIAVALESAGIGTWAGQLLLKWSRGSARIRLIAIMVVAAIFSGLIGMNGASAAMIPIVVVIAVRTGTAPSKLMIPLAFACLTGAKLTLLGTPVNVIAATQAEYAQAGHIGFFEWSILGIPQLLGTIAITVLLGKYLLPERQSAFIPADFSAHAQTLVEHYRLEEGLHQLRVRESSSLVGQGRKSIDLGEQGLDVISVTGAGGVMPRRRHRLEPGDRLLVRGDVEAVAGTAERLHLGICDEEESEATAGLLMDRSSGLAEVVIPPRSQMIGHSVFPGMATEDGKLMVLALQRGGQEIRRLPAKLRAGDHLLLQGTWNALDDYLADPHVIAVDSPDLVKRQTVALGKGAPAAIAILVLLVVLLAFNLVPAAVAAVLCATLMVLTRVVSLPTLLKRVDWNTGLLIGAMIPPAVAMTKTGTAAMIGDGVVAALGGAGPYVVLGGLFLASALVSQFISNTSSALVMMPIGLATAVELGVSPLPMMLAVAMGASASFLTPFANGVSLIVYGPGGYRFGDFWRLGLVVLAWTFVVTIVIVPLAWPF